MQYVVLGNAGTLVAFRLGAKDAPLLARECMDIVDAGHLVGLANYEVYVKLTIDEEPSRPFRARTLFAGRASNTCPQV